MYYFVNFSLRQISLQVARFYFEVICTNFENMHITRKTKFVLGNALVGIIVRIILSHVFNEYFNIRLEALICLN